MNIRHIVLALLIGIISLILAIFGSNILNNEATTSLPVVSIIISLIGLLVLVFTTDNKYKWMPLYVLTLALLFTTSSRSNYISGVDMNIEYQMMQTTINDGTWSPISIKHAYYYMLSLTLLPLSIFKITGLNALEILKYIFPALYAFVPVFLYLSARNLHRGRSVMFPVLIFIAIPTFLSGLSIPYRQQIAFLTISIIVYLVSSSRFSFFNNVYLYILTFALVTSHYTSTYIYIVILATGLFLKLLLLLLFKIRTPVTYLSWIYLLFTILCTFVWYWQVTPLGSGQMAVITNSVTNIRNVFNQDVRGLNDNLSQQFWIQNRNVDRKKYFNSEVEKVSNIFSNEDVYSISDPDKLDLLMPENVLKTPNKLSFTHTKLVYLFVNLSDKLLKVVILFGSYILLRRGFVAKQLNEVDILSLTATLALAVSIFMPNLSLEYSLLRNYQNLSLFLFPAIVTLFAQIKTLYKYVFGVMLFFMIVYSTGLLGLITGGVDKRIAFTNDIDIYTSFSEISSASWLFINKKEVDPIQADIRSVNKLWITRNMAKQNDRIINSVYRGSILKNSYVYSSVFNTQKSIAFSYVQGAILSYQLPIQEIDNNKNKVYSNGKSVLYR